MTKSSQEALLMYDTTTMISSYISKLAAQDISTKLMLNIIKIVILGFTKATAHTHSVEYTITYRYHTISFFPAVAIMNTYSVLESYRSLRENAISKNNMWSLKRAKWWYRECRFRLSRKSASTWLPLDNRRFFQRQRQTNFKIARKF